uniref:protein tilB homolog n=1 Tax=Styela clava TaxID=7725 RepID=UPI0019395814|nr:protein tilB homolog [Styela clava]
MVRITEQLIRKRAEHNECEIYTLEEISLHQQDIEKIEYLDKWCKDLKILYLQSNLIDKIENVGKLKKLEYLNLALNNVAKIENMQGCESLQKLDLTLNFVSEVTTIESLRSNYFLEEIYLTGNPCVNFEGYRQYVIAALPQLQRLDGQTIEKSERIQACQDFDSIRLKILQQQKEYESKKTDDEKQSQSSGNDAESKSEDNDKTEEENADFWNSKCDYTPESRKEMHSKMKENREKKSKPMFEKPEFKRTRRYFNDAGDPMNINEGKVDFSLTETEDDSAFVLDVACFKYLDTSLIDVDVQPKYVKVTLKSDVLQLVLQDEVLTDKSTAQRSQTTGHLVVTMPKLNPPPKPIQTTNKPDTKLKKNSSKNVKDNKKTKNIETLEYDSSKSMQNTLANITKEEKHQSKGPLTLKSKKKLVNKEQMIQSDDFIDNPDVPPLI